MDQTGIYNASLGRIGIAESVSAPTDRTVRAEVCNRFYDSCRQEVIRAFPWPFATRNVALAQVASYTIPGWTYVYDTPDNSLRILAVTDLAGLRAWNSVYQCDDSQRYTPTRYPWQIMLRNDAARQVIVTDLSPAYAFYLYDVTNTGAFPADFSSVLADRLSMEIAGPLKADAALASKAEQRYVLWNSRAAATAFNESRDDVRPESASITARY